MISDANREGWLSFVPAQPTVEMIPNPLFAYCVRYAASRTLRCNGPLGGFVFGSGVYPHKAGRGLCRIVRAGSIDCTVCAIEWQDIQQAVTDLLRRLTNAGQTPDAIVTVTRCDDIEMHFNRLLATEIAIQINSEFPSDDVITASLSLSQNACEGSNDQELHRVLAQRQRVLVPTLNPLNAAQITRVCAAVIAHSTGLLEILVADLMSGRAFAAFSCAESPEEFVFHLGLGADPEVCMPWSHSWASTDGDCPTPLQSTGTFQVVRPWGWMDVVCINQDGCSVRILNVLPNRRLSLQRHRLRDELFVALDDGVVVDIAPVGQGIRSLRVRKGHSLLIPKLTWHRFHSDNGLRRCLEVAFGHYDQGDIERAGDDYGRPMNGDAEPNAIRGT